MTKLLKRRANQSIVRLELGQRPSQEMLALLERVIQVETHQIYYDSAPLSMGYVYDLEKALSPDLRARLTYPAYHPRWPEDLNRQESMIEQIRRKDRLLFFPFDSIDPFLRLLEEAADRPDVASIKITIYRLASTSKIARILCRAAENGKEVVASWSFGLGLTRPTTSPGPKCWRKPGARSSTAWRTLSVTASSA